MVHLSATHTSPISFMNFIVAAYQGKVKDRLVVQNGQVTSWGRVYDSEIGKEALNKQIWRVFREALASSLSSERIDHACSRYGIDLSRMEDSGSPLKTRHIEYFGVAGGNVYTFDLQDEMEKNVRNPGPLSSSSVDQIRQYVLAASQHRYLGRKEDPKVLTGGPRESHEQIVNSSFNSDRIRLSLGTDVESLRWREENHPDPRIPDNHPYYSRLSMAIVSHLETSRKKPDLEVIIPAPGGRPYSQDYYKVHKIISLGGLNAFALTPVSKHSTLPPILSFRCTKQTLVQSGAFPSNFNNADKNIGESGYKAAKEALTALMEDEGFHRGKKITVLSYSQGGAHGSYFMRDHWEQVDELVCFNGTGADSQVVEDFADQINALPENRIPPKIYHYRNVCDAAGRRGDWVNKAGKKHIGWGIKHPNAIVQVVQFIIDNVPHLSENIFSIQAILKALEFHAIRPMDCSRKYQFNTFRGPTQCDPILDTYNRDRTLEDARVQWGHNTFLSIGRFFYDLTQLIFRIFGPDFLRKKLRF
ncbi:MAG: hypothetical protein KR126chlam1_00195 [Chlamydiae bacterium]|nr:hypothetical protein [Chlamydiota bacterium]